MLTPVQGFYYANGVALSPDDSYVVMAETDMIRAHKIWVKGPKVGVLSTVHQSWHPWPMLSEPSRHLWHMPCITSEHVHLPLAVPDRWHSQGADSFRCCPAFTPRYAASHDARLPRSQDTITVWTLHTPHTCTHEQSYCIHVVLSPT